MDQKRIVSVWYFVLMVLGMYYLQSYVIESKRIETIAYSEMIQLLESSQIAAIEVNEQHILAKLKSAAAGGRQYVTTPRMDADLVKLLSQYDVEYEGIIESHFLATVLSWVVPMAVFVGLWYFIMRRMSGAAGGLGGLTSIGKSKAKVYVETDTQVNFADVAGVDEAKLELQEVVSFLKEPDQYGRLGAHVPKGILLLGPPGTGKTLLARAVAGEAKVPFFSINGSEFVEMFVGVGAARVRDLFDQARQQAPCIIFIDELDAVGRARGINPYGGGHDEKEQTLNQLLSELDGFDPGQQVVLLAATNRPEILDPALLRPGRFDRQVLVDRPDKIGRVAILMVHLKKVQVDTNFKADEIAALTPGFTGADLANLVNEAAVLATRRDADTITLDDFTNAVERIVAGLEKRNRLLNPREREVVAYHEMGHALVALSLPGTDVVHKVSIIPRGVGALGYTIQRPTEDRFLMTSTELEEKMAVLLGGRASEVLIFNELSTGAADDFAKATDIARNMVMRFGMDKKLGLVAYEQPHASFLPGVAEDHSGMRRYSETTAREIDNAVHDILEVAFNRALDILKQRRELLAKCALKLLEHETLSREELLALVGNDSSATAPSTNIRTVKDNQ
jgi:cell division protease FtsH